MDMQSVGSEAELCAWLGQALPGEIRRYHRGHLALDTNPHSRRLSDKARQELGKAAKRARWASERGLVHLLQRRRGSDDYDYLIVARPRPQHSSKISERLGNASATREVEP